MKIFKLLLLVVVITAASASQTQWREVLEKDGFRFFLDWSTLKKNGEVIRIWTLRSATLYNPKAQFNSGMSLTEFDCTKDQVRELQIHAFKKQMGKEDLGELHGDSLGLWYFPVPDSTMFKMMRVVCSNR